MFKKLGKGLRAWSPAPGEIIGPALVGRPFGHVLLRVSGSNTAAPLLRAAARNGGVHSWKGRIPEKPPPLHRMDSATSQEKLVLPLFEQTLTRYPQEMLF